jgi:hypothetical protein
MRNQNLALARFAAGILLIDTVKPTAATDELITRLLCLDRGTNFHG